MRSDQTPGFLGLSRRVLLLSLPVVALVQLAIPVNMIRAKEVALKRGTAYRFQTAPVDPVDVFRGRFVALNYNQRTAPARPGLEVKRGQWVYAQVGVGEDGFAHFLSVDDKPPAAGDYMRVRTHSRISSSGSSQAVALDLPFNRLYMDEHKAPAAEAAVWRQRRQQGEELQPSYAVVRVHRGQAVLEDVVVGGVPIVEAAEAVLREKEAE